MKKLILFILVVSMFSACEPVQRIVKHEKVKCYKTHHKDSDVFIYWYLWTDSNTTYYYQSSAPVSTYSTIVWSRSLVTPPELQELENENLAEEISETEVSETEFSAETQSETDTSDSDGGSDGDSSGEGDSDGDGGED